MIIVHGELDVAEQHWDSALSLSHQHVTRSRQEAGCISHAVLIDAEHPHRLVFFEEWTDWNALQAHFEVPASAEFMSKVSAIATAPPRLRMFESSPLKAS